MEEKKYTEKEMKWEAEKLADKKYEKALMVKRKTRKNVSSIREHIILKTINILNVIFHWNVEGKRKLFDDVPEYILEYFLFKYGSCMIFKYNGVYFCTRYSPCGELDVYGRLTKARPIGVGKTGTKLNEIFSNMELVIRDIVDPSSGEVIKPNAVILKNDFVNSPTLATLKPIVDRLCYAWESVGITQANNRTKRIFIAIKI